MKKARDKGDKLAAVHTWHGDLIWPEGISNSTYKKFLQYATLLFPDHNHLWKKDAHGAHKLVIQPGDHLWILSQVNDNLGHQGFYVTWAAILQWFWWPHLQPDIVWFIQTCHICQVQKTTQVQIPPTVVTPAPLFTKSTYINTMHMPASQGFKYIIQGHCSVCT